MIVVSNTAAVTLEAGQSLTFTNIVWKSGCAESFRSSGTAVRIGQGVYELKFSGNISGATAGTPVQLSIAVNGSPLPETAMISTPAVAGDVNNVGTSTIVGNQVTCCSPIVSALSVSVVNTGTTAVTVAPNSKLTVKREG